MDDKEKTKEELIAELTGLRERVSILEHADAELQRVRKALVQGAEALNVVLENSNDILAILRPDGTMGYISPAVEKATGYRLEELGGVYAFDLIHPDDTGYLLKTFSSGLESPGRTINVEFRYRHSDGSWHTMEAQGINLRDNPTVNGMVLTARDITDRKNIEQELQRSEGYYRSLIRNAADMISVLDTDLTFRWGSRSSGRITGYTPADIYGRSFFDFTHPDNTDDARKALDFTARNPGVPRYIEFRFLHADSSYHFHAAMLTGLDEPSVQGVIINSRDISERRLMEDELLASNRELDSFATTVAHDLRTPLSLIEGYAQLMQAKNNSEEEKEAYLRSIISAARRMDELTESLLGYAQAGQPAGAVSPVEPLEVISDIILEHSSILESTGIDVILGEEFPTINVDTFKLRQVITNLVNNATKHLTDSPHPRIEIGSQTDGGLATFYVRDNGPGLEPELKDEVFLPFKRFSSSNSPGLGIGLSTVKRAVEGWGGRVWIESEPGKGATFYFTAPLESD